MCVCQLPPASAIHSYPVHLQLLMSDPRPQHTSPSPSNSNANISQSNEPQYIIYSNPNTTNTSNTRSINNIITLPKDSLYKYQIYKSFNLGLVSQENTAHIEWPFCKNTHFSHLLPSNSRTRLLLRYSPQG